MSEISEKMKEKIEFSFTEEEFIKEIVGNVVDRKSVKALLEANPIMTLLVVMLGKEVWEEMCEYNRRIEVAKILGESEEK